MLSKEEIEKARSNILRGNDVESASTILKAVILDNYIEIGGRVNTLKIATRQILNFIEENKNKGNLDYIKEKVKANNKVKQLETREQKLIEKLEGDKYIIESTYSQINGDYFMAQDKLDYIKEILSMLKGEKE